MSPKLRALVPVDRQREPNSGENFMYGHLVPCRGGKSIPLTNARVYLGKRAERPDAASQRTSYYCEVAFEEGAPILRELDCPFEIRVNGHPVTEAELKSGDLIALGKLRYRLQLAEPEAPAETPEHTERRSRTAAVLSLFRFGKKTEDVPASEPPVLGVLVPCGGGKATPLRKKRNTVGRESSCDVVIADRTVSGLHCGLEYVDDCWQVVDLASTNGVMVNGVAYKKKWILPDDILMISLHRFRLEYRPERTPPEEDDVPFTGRPLMEIAGIDRSTVDRIAEEHERPGAAPPTRQELPPADANSAPLPAD